jgi:2-hydroxy-3-oxopropionate reductase
MKIAFLGTGLMGAPMVRRLATAGFELSVWNRSAARATALAGIATVCDTAESAILDADVVIMMLLDGPVTAEVLSPCLSLLKPGTLIIDMGSVDPDTDRALAAFSARLELHYLDAPVSGGVVGAEAGTLAIFAGGTAEAYAMALPVFAPLGRATHLGAVGAGQVAKLANQLIVATTIGAVAEGLRLAEAGGCDPAALREALKGGFADSRILDLHGKRMVSADFVPGGRSVAQLKDLDNVMALAEASGLELPLGTTITASFRDFVENHGGAELDHSAYYLWLEQRWS